LISRRWVAFPQCVEKTSRPRSTSRQTPTRRQRGPRFGSPAEINRPNLTTFFALLEIAPPARTATEKGSQGRLGFKESNQDDDENTVLPDPDGAKKARGYHSLAVANVIQKKIALLGAPGVGKTSLVRQFVQSIFDESYLTTLGVKVDKKQVVIGRQEVTLMVWDVAGAEEHFAVPTSYIRGSAGYLLVVDGSRPDTLDRGLDIIKQVDGEIGRLPFVFVLNKIDLVEGWRIQEADLSAIQARGCPILRTSAKTGVGVEEAFLQLAELVIAPPSSA
jgi:small GTP-binding protein